MKNCTIRGFPGNLSIEKRTINPECEAFSSTEQFPFLRDTDLMEQVYREIYRRGREGMSHYEGVEYFKCTNILVRYITKALRLDGRVNEIAGNASRNVEFRYVAPEHDCENIPVNRNEKVTANPRTLYRTNVIKDLFQNPNTVLTRYQICKKVYDAVRGYGEAIPDHKSVKRILSALVADGFLLEVKLEGVSKMYKDEIIYHKEECEKEYVKNKIKLITSSDIAQIDKLNMGIFLSCLSKPEDFVNPIPDSVLSDEVYITHGYYFGPIAVFFEELHFCLSVLYFGWQNHESIPDRFSHLSKWWEYVCSLKRVPKNENGFCEVKDILYYLPIEPYIYCCTKNLRFIGLNKILADKRYKYLCMGQLPSEILTKIGKSSIAVINLTVRTIALLETLELVEFEDKNFDLTKRKFVGFGFRLVSRRIMLNTIGAPISKRSFRGFNLRRILLDDRIKVFEVSVFHEFIRFWDEAKKICLNGDMPGSKNATRNCREPPKSLEEYMRENDILTNEIASYYERSDVKEKLNGIYTELGPAGFQIQLNLHQYQSWRMLSNPTLFKRKGIFVSGYCPKSTKPIPKQSSYSESDEEDYVVINDRSKVYSKTRKKVALARKRKINTSGNTRAPKKKCIARVRAKDEKDAEVNELRIANRTSFTEKEDMILLMISVCDDVTDGLKSSYAYRDLLHKYCPSHSLDKRALPCQKRVNLLLKRTGEIPAYVDYKQKSFLYAKKAFPDGTDLQTLMSHRDKWLRLGVRCSISRDYENITKSHMVSLPEKLTGNFVRPYCWELSTRGKRRRHKILKVLPVWETQGLLLHEERKLYQLIQISISSKSYSDEAQKTAQTLFQQYPSELLNSVFNTMKYHNVISQRLKVTPFKFSISIPGLSFSNDASAAAFQSAFPSIMKVRDLRRTKTEIEYCTLQPGSIESFIQLMAVEKLGMRLGKVVISGCLRPLVDKHIYISLCQSQEKETEVFEEFHTKGATFFSGIHSLEQAKAVGFGVTDKHIKGRTVSINHKIAQDEASINCYEELLGINESSRVLPLKIFALNTGGNKFSWGKVSFKSGKMTKNHHMTCSNGAVSISLQQLTQMRSKFLQSMEKSKETCIKLFENTCNAIETFGGQSRWKGLLLIEEIYTVKKTGITFDSAVGILTSDTFSEQAARRLIELLMSLEIIVKVGFTKAILVAYFFSEEWQILPKASTHEDNADTDSEQFSEYFPLTIKSWRLPNGDINEEFLSKTLVSIVHYIYYAPGISMWRLNQRYHHFLTSENLKEIMEFLLNVNVVRTVLSRPPPSTLFSSTVPVIKIDPHKLDMDSCFRLTSSAMEFASGLQNKKFSTFNGKEEPQLAL